MRWEHSHAEFVRPAGLLELGAGGEQRVDRLGRLQMILLCAVLGRKTSVLSERESDGYFYRCCWLLTRKGTICTTHTHTHTHTRNWKIFVIRVRPVQDWITDLSRAVYMGVNFSQCHPHPLHAAGADYCCFHWQKDTMFQNAYGIYKAGNSVGGKIPGTQRREYIATQQSN